MEGRAKAKTKGKRTGHPAHLPPEFGEVVSGVDGLTEDAGDQDKPYRQRGKDDDGELSLRGLLTKGTRKSVS
jgi:hypothetical protein